MSAPPGVCDKCGTPARERFETLTGRLVCQACADDTNAGTAALLTGGGAGGAFAIRGWMRRARAWRRRGQGHRPDPE